MKALIFKEIGKIEWSDQPDPEIGTNQVLIRIKTVGICGSDVLGFTGKTTKRTPPLIMGHEFGGEVLSAPENSQWRPGDRVAVQPILYCGVCKHCLKGDFNLCNQRILLGAGVTNGAMAEYIAVPQQNLVKIAANVDWVEAAMVEPTAVALRAVKTAQIGPTDSVAIIGSGTIGLLVLMLVRQTTTGSVAIFDIDPSRLNLAKDLGADYSINTSKYFNEIEMLKKMNLEGFNILIEAAGFSETLGLGLKLASKKSRLVNLGGWNHRATIDLSQLVTKEIQLVGSFNFNNEFVEAVDLINREKIDTRRIVSRVYPMSDGAKAFADLLNKNNQLIKVLLTND